MKLTFLAISIIVNLSVFSQENENIPTSGYYSTVTLGVMPAQQFSGTFHVVNGYVANPHWSFGIGVGTESIGNRSYLPAYLTTKYNLFSTPTTPYASVMAGYDFALSNTNFTKGGFTTGIQFGLDHFFNKHVGITTSAGYRYAYLKVKNSWWDDFFTIREINRVELKFGLIIR